MHNDNQFSLSYSLLILLQWLTEHESSRLSKLITKALNSGLKEELANALANTSSDSDLQETLHYSIVDFFALLETTLAEQMHQQTTQKAREKNLMPALEHLDATLLDDETVKTTLGKVISVIDNRPHENANELLFKELLKSWKPHKKDLTH